MAGPPRAILAAALTAASLFLVPASSSPAGAEAIDFPEAVARAIGHNADVSAAGQEWVSAKKEIEAARGRYLPSLTFEEKYVRTNQPAEVFAIRMNQERLLASDFADVDNFNKPSPAGDFIAALTLEQAIFAPKALLGYEMAGREADARALDLARRKEEAVHRVLTAYLDVLTAKEYARIAERALDDAREHLRVAEAVERAGTGLSSDVLRAKVSVASAESAKVTAESRLAVARTALGLAMGGKRGLQVDASAPIPDLPESGILDERIAALRGSRSDLRALSVRLGNADANVTFHRSDYLPNVGVTGVYQVDGRDGPFSPDNRTWKVGVGLTWTLFDGFRREAAVAKAAAGSARAREYDRGAGDQAAFQVTRAYLSVGEAERRVEIARAAAAAAEEGTRLVKARYENQLARMVDLLDAQNALDTARADLVRAENDRTRSKADLEYAAGTLLSWALPGAKEPR